MVIKLLFTVSIFLIGISSFSYGQSVPATGGTAAQSPTLLPQRVPPSPTAAALERYALMPVTESAGTPTINLPLYEIHSGQLTVPLSLSYHASGVRVSDAASWVGLGWSLNAGGVITRVVRGLPDEDEGGFNENYKTVPQTNTFGLIFSRGTPTSLYYLLEHAAAARTEPRKLDYEPDLYTYNCPGQSGCFMRDNHGEYQPLPLKPITIAVGDSAITLVDEHGTNYLFKDTEYSRTNPSRGRLHNISAWYLTRMVSADQTDTIRFTYARAGKGTLNTVLNQQISIVSNAVKILDGGDGQIPIPQDTYKDDTYSYTSVATKRLSRIEFKGGYVAFQALDNRLDGVGDETLRSLVVVAYNGQDTLKRVTFYHSYFNQNDISSSNAASFWRLRLDSVATAAGGGNIQLPPYRFAYNATPLPDKVTGSRDYWGYPNGAGTSYSPTGQPWLVPATVVESVANRGPMQVGGADRKVNPDYTQAGMLTDLHYPTGGWHHFTYEPNTLAERYEVPNPRTSVTVNATTPPGGFEGGGQRVTDERVFSITYPVARVRAAINIAAGNDAKDRLHSQGTITLTDITDTAAASTVATWSGTAAAPNNNTFNLDSPDGRPYLKTGHVYKIGVTATGAASANIALSYEAATITYAVHNIITGGVRLREQRIQAAPQAAATIKRYYYNKADSLESSGYLINAIAPLFSRKTISRIEGPGDPNCGPFSSLCPQKSIIDLTYTTVSTNSLGELEGTEQAVGYGTVTVVDSATTGQVAGRTVSTYSKQRENGTNRKPYPPKAIASWKRGNLLTQQHYRQTATGKLELMQKLVNEYETLDSVQIQGLTVMPDASFTGGTLFTLEGEPAPYFVLEGPPPPLERVYPFAYINTVQLSGWQRVARTRRYQYAGGDTSVYHLTTTAYRYANPRHQQPTLVETTLANGQRQQVHSRYAADYDVTQISNSSSPSAQALGELLRTHAVAQLVEQTTTRLTPTDTLVTQSSLSLFRVLAPSVVVPARQLAYQASTPTPWHRFQRADLRAGQLLTDAHYETRLVFDRYDAQRQLTQAHVVGGTPLTYLWDNATSEPLAKVTNATSNQVASTSFEPGATGRWAYDSTATSPYRVRGGRTGRWAYELGPAQNQVWRINLPAATYELLLWAQGGAPALYQNGVLVPPARQQLVATSAGGWQQYRTRLVLPARADGNAVQLLAPAGSTLRLDEVRLAPVGSELTSYTYDALRGMTSQTDPTGRTLTYEYDGLGRLVRTRDEQGRILSQQQYHYASK